MDAQSRTTNTYNTNGLLVKETSTAGKDIDHIYVSNGQLRKPWGQIKLISRDIRLEHLLDSFESSDQFNLTP